MAVVRNCIFPDDLYYDVPNHTWYKREEGNLVRAGITPVAVVLAREVIVFTPKRPGKDFEKGKSFATLESAKWVGSVRAAFAGVVAAVNESLVERPKTVNRDCFGEGWMLLMRPAAEDWHTGLVTGSAVGPAYERWMDEMDFPGCAGL